MEITGTPIPKSSSIRVRSRVLENAFLEIVQKNSWNIRNCEIFDKLANWISSYLETGNTCAYANICKLKVMTHGNVPIYNFIEME